MSKPRDVKEAASAGLSNSEKRVLGNRYRVEKKLGSGNFGTAFLVTDLNDENDRLKVLKEISISDMEADESIESVQEAQLLSKLDNPYILKYHESFLDGDFFCIVTEYCEGGDLDVHFKKLKKEKRRLSEEQILDWTIQLLSAVNYMHSRRVLHRDLKARNIFLKNGVVKIGDFGISRILQGTMDMAATFTGTPYYMSPEVLKHEGYNSKSDVWSVGCLLYEMCTLKHAFEGQGLMGVMYKIVEGKVPEIPKEYSTDLNLILKKIFNKNPNERPSSSELLREPYVVNHLQKMITRLTEAKSFNDCESTVVIRNDRNEIANALSKMSLKDLQLHYGKPSKSTTSTATTEATELAAPNSSMRPRTKDTINYSNVNSEKEFTPKERMLLNKLKKADEQAAVVGRVAKENYEERMMRETFRREATIHLNNSTMIGGSPEPKRELDNYMNHSMQNFNRTFHLDSERYQPKYSEEHYMYSNQSRVNKNKIVQIEESDDDDEGTLLETMSFNAINAKEDFRPIIPLKKNIEMSFNEDGIPLDPQLANQYYESFNDFEMDDASPERKPNLGLSGKHTSSSVASSQYFKQTKNSLSKTVVPSSHQNRRRVNTAIPRRVVNPINNKLKITNQTEEHSLSSNRNSNSKTLQANPAEYAHLMDVQKSVTSSSHGSKKSQNSQFGDDSQTGAFGARIKQTKIHNLKTQAIRNLGPAAFQECYDFLKEKRSTQKHQGSPWDEGLIFEGLKQIIDNPSDGFLVDQLLFLESEL